MRRARPTIVASLLVLVFARSAVAAPGEAGNLRWCSGTKECLEWDQAVPNGRYRVLRGDRTTLPGLVDASIDSCALGVFTVTTTASHASENPSAGQLFWYLVQAETCSARGPAGTGSFGPEIVDPGGDCAMPSCANGRRDGAEAGVDCGGPCTPCAGGETCCTGGDCESALCLTSDDQGTCAAITCTNGTIDGTETDVDCGGSSCPGCGTSEVCATGSDCANRVCTGGHCAAPTCADGVRNGSETDVDCGGTACAFCADGSECAVSSDCSSATCQAGQCAAAACVISRDPSPASPAGCGSSGNTYWYNDLPVGFATMAAVDDAAIYVTWGSTASLLSSLSGMEVDSSFFSGVTLNQPLVYSLRYPISIPATDKVLLLTGSNGIVYFVNPQTLQVLASRSLQRVGYGSDSISATPVVQTYEDSDANYRALRSVDLVIAGTDYPGGDSTNRIHGLDGATGDIVWSYNVTGASNLNSVRGLALDRGRNLVHVVADKAPLITQNTVLALRTTNGARLWGRVLGAVDAAPVLDNGGLFVATRGGILYKLNPANGATVWQLTVAAGLSLTDLAVDGGNGRVYVVDGNGTLHAIGDQCGSGSPLWAFPSSPGVKVTAKPALLGAFLYAGANDGRTYQIRASDGVALAYATVSGTASPSSEPVVLAEGQSTRLLAASGGILKKLCIPWPDTTGDKARLLFSWRPSVWLASTSDDIDSSLRTCSKPREMP